jgi:hypothetical protein
MNLARNMYIIFSEIFNSNSPVYFIINMRRIFKNIKNVGSYTKR